MQPTNDHVANPIPNPVPGMRAEVAELLDTGGPAMSWAARLHLAEAFNYLDDTTAQPTPPPQRRLRAVHPADAVAQVTRVREQLLALIQNPPEGIDIYALGHAAGQLRAALHELTTVRPA